MLNIVKNTLRALSLSAVIFLSFPHHSEAADFSEYNLPLLKQGNEMMTSVLKTNQLFNAVAVETEGKVGDLSVNFGQGWEKVVLEDDYGLGLEGLIFTSPRQQIQFKASGTSEVGAVLKLNLTHAEQDQVGIGGPDDGILEASNGLTDMGLSVISRAQWGADESLRVKKPSSPGSGGGTYVDPCADIVAKYGDHFKLSSVQKYNENGEELTWPVAISTAIEKFSIHHTDSEIRDLNGDGLIDGSDYQAMVRAIYHFHTISRGWGDIGYTYLIDPLGNIYEGRSGGEMAVGAHSLCFNQNVIGIAMIGNYENQEISEAAFNSLTALIAQDSKKYNIDPLASSEFSGKYLENIFGHRDVRATSCPGTSLYAELPKIRDRAAALFQNLPQGTSFDFNAEFVSATPIKVLDLGESQTVTLTFKNTGKSTWESNSWLFVNANTNPYAKIVPIVEGKTFVGADLKEKSVAPGKTGTFEITVQALTKEGEYSFQVSPVINSKYKISRTSPFVKFQVKDSGYDYEIMQAKLPTGKVFQGQEITATIKLKNTGKTAWHNDGENPIRLGATGPQDRASEFIHGDRTRMGYMTQQTVEPGEVGDFIMQLHVPTDKTGIMTEHFVPVLENLRWLVDKKMSFTVNVLKPMALAEVTKLTPVNDLLPGQKRSIEFEIKNIGRVDWNPSNFKVVLAGAELLDDKNSVVPTQTIKPGEKIKISVNIKIPLEYGTYILYVKPKLNGLPIFQGTGGFIKGVYKPGSTVINQEVHSPAVPTPKPALPSTPEPVATTVKPFRVKISHEASSATLTADTDFVVLNEKNEVLLNQAKGTEVMVTKNGTAMEIKSGNLTKTGTVVRLVPKVVSGVTEIKTMERRPSWNTSLNDNRFRGTMEMRVIADKMTYINELPMEDYLKGLAEVSNTAPIEKQKVLAVLARTYARFYMDEANRKFPGLPYDGSDDPDVFQKYLGYGVEMRAPNFIKAVDGTKDMVVTYGGKLVKTPYFNQSDGKTRSAQEVWGWTNTPYLVSVPDPWSNGLTLSGHGVGLSGLGATKQAEAGKKFDEIIKYYYTGVAVQTMSFK